MKQTTMRKLSSAGLLMVFSGIGDLALLVILVISQIRSPQSSRILIVLSALLMIACAAFAIAAGVKSLSLTKNINNGQRVRAANSKILSGRRFALIALILCLVQVFLSCISGIILWQLFALIVLGILIPLIYLISTRTIS